MFKKSLLCFNCLDEATVIQIQTNLKTVTLVKPETEQIIVMQAKSLKSQYQDAWDVGLYAYDSSSDHAHSRTFGMRWTNVYAPLNVTTNYALAPESARTCIQRKYLKHSVANCKITKEIE